MKKEYSNIRKFTLCGSLLLFLFFSCKENNSITDPVSTEPTNKEYGTLVLSSNPQGGKIIIDNNLTDRITPDTLILSAGDHLVSVKSTGYASANGTLTIIADSTISAEFNLLHYSHYFTTSISGFSYDLAQSKLFLYCTFYSNIGFYRLGGLSIKSVEIFYESPDSNKSWNSTPEFYLASVHDGGTYVIPLEGDQYSSCQKGNYKFIFNCMMGTDDPFIKEVNYTMNDCGF